MISNIIVPTIAALLAILLHSTAGGTLANGLGSANTGNITVFQYRYSQWWRMSDTIKTMECVALSPSDTRWIDIDSWLETEDTCIRVYTLSGCNGDYIDVRPANNDRKHKICFEMEAKSLSNCRRYPITENVQITTGNKMSLARYRRQSQWYPIPPLGGFPNSEHPFWYRFRTSRTTEPTRIPSTTPTVPVSAQNHVDDWSEPMHPVGVSREPNPEDNYIPQIPDLTTQTNMNGVRNDNSIKIADETNEVAFEEDTGTLASEAEGRWSPPVKICFMN